MDGTAKEEMLLCAGILEVVLHGSRIVSSKPTSAAQLGVEESWEKKEIHSKNIQGKEPIAD